MESIIRIAFRDIHKHLEEVHKITIHGNLSPGAESFIVRRYVDAPESHKLNEALKIRGLNMKGNNNHNSLNYKKQ